MANFHPLNKKNDIDSEIWGWYGELTVDTQYILFQKEAQGGIIFYLCHVSKWRKSDKYTRFT